jgi:DNA-binding NarL/FixJ family response regulator
VNLILADSNDLMRLGLRTVLTAELNVTIVGEARSEKELLSQLASFGATLVLIDFTSEGFTIDTLQRISTKYPDLKFLAVTSAQNAQTLVCQFIIGLQIWVCGVCT